MTLSSDFAQVDAHNVRVTPELITAVAQRIQEAIQPQRIILFGSQATGEAEADSDLDLLILLNDNHPLAGLDHHHRARRISRLFPHRLFGLDIFALTEKEVSAIQTENEGEWNLILEILDEGKLLYERSLSAAAE